MTEREYNDSVDEYADGLYRFIVKNLKHHADAEDIVQSSFEVLWQKRADVNTATCKQLLYTIAYRKMIDHIRRNKKMVFEESLNMYENRPAEANNYLKAALNHALETLDDDKRALVLLKDYEGYSYEEIGQITGLNSNQVKVYLHRARVQLRDYIVKIENLI